MNRTFAASISSSRFIFRHFHCIVIQKLARVRGGRSRSFLVPIYHFSDGIKNEFDDKITEILVWRLNYCSYLMLCSFSNATLITISECQAFFLTFSRQPNTKKQENHSKINKEHVEAFIDEKRREENLPKGSTEGEEL